MPHAPLFSVFSKTRYLAIGLLAAWGMLGLYLYTQVLGNLANLDIWFANVPPLRALLVVVFAGLFGITLAYQFFLWKQPKICSRVQKLNAGGTSGIGTIGIFLVAQCPACASLGALFLPVSMLSFLGQYAVELNLISIGLLVFTLHYLGAFTPDSFSK